MNMPRATNGSVELEYDHFGAPTDPALLLVMGYTAQMTAWDDEFCGLLADAGHFVVRFDNRDCGLSSKTQADPPDMMALLMQALAGQPITVEVPYTLRDMAGDALAVLDAVGVEAAHVVGASMGGMIVQQMAIDHPTRVMSMTSIMSTTGAPGVGQPTPAAQVALLTPPPSDPSGIVDWMVTTGQAISGPLFDEAAARERAAAAYERSFYPAGAPFQMAAIAKTGDRTAGLEQLDVSTLVIHGKLDALISVSGGEATAAAVPNAKLLVLDEMAHDLPKPLWADMIGAISDLTRV